MNFTAQQLADLFEGVVQGDPDVSAHRLSKIEQSVPNSITSLSNSKYEKYIYDNNAAIILVNRDYVLKPDVEIKPTIVRVNNAYSAFSELLALYESNNHSVPLGMEQPSFISDSATIGDNHYIGAFTYIGKNVVIGKNVKIYPQVYVGANVEIGDNSIIYPGVKIYHGCKLGESVILHAGTVIGSDGFGFAPTEGNSYLKIPQIGNVIIEDNVEIGSNTTIDRATLGSTVIKQGVKLDNLIQIAHNVEVGENSVIAAQTGISGSSKIGEHVIIGGQVGIAGHISIAKGTQIQAQSGLNRTIKQENIKLAGTPAMSYTNELRSRVLYTRLPDIEKRLSLLEKRGLK